MSGRAAPNSGNKETPPVCLIILLQLETLIFLSASKLLSLFYFFSAIGTDSLEKEFIPVQSYSISYNVDKIFTCSIQNNPPKGGWVFLQ